MKVPVSWLKDFVDINIPIEDLAHILTVSGLEVEEIHYVGWEMPTENKYGFKINGIPWDKDKIIVAEIRAVNPPVYGPTGLGTCGQSAGVVLPLPPVPPSATYRLPSGPKVSPRGLFSPLAKTETFDCARAIPTHRPRLAIERQIRRNIRHLIFVRAPTPLAQRGDRRRDHAAPDDSESWGTSWKSPGFLSARGRFRGSCGTVPPSMFRSSRAPRRS